MWRLAADTHGSFRRAGSASWFEEFDGIPVRILYLDLSTTGTGLHLVAKVKPRLLQFSDEAWKIGDFEYHPIPPAGLLLLSIRHRSRARCAGTAQEKLRVTKGDAGERGE